MSVLDLARQRAGDHAQVGAAREVEELVAEQLDLLRRDLRAALVDLGLLRRWSGRSTAVFVRDSSPMRTKSLRTELAGELVDDARAGRARPRGRWRSPAGRASSATRATLTPLPPASCVCSTVRWRRPSRKLGTDRVLSMAVLRVTVTIIAALSGVSNCLVAGAHFCSGRGAECELPEIESALGGHASVCEGPRRSATGLRADQPIVSVPAARRMCRRRGIAVALQQVRARRHFPSSGDGSP